MVGTNRGVKMPFEKLIKRYALSLTMLCALVVAWFVLIETEAETQTENLKIVNKAGRQRVLSQRIVKDMLMVVNSDDVDSTNFYKLELEDGLMEFTSNHKRLLVYNRSLSKEYRDLVDNFFVEIDLYYDEIVASGYRMLSLLKEHDRLGEEASEALIAAIHMEQFFLPVMNDIVNTYEKASTPFNKALQHVKEVILLLIVTTLLFEAFFIFRPIAKDISYQIRTLKLGACDKLTVISEISQELDVIKSSAKAKSQLLASMSQEIRTPLQGVLGMANLLEQTTITEEQRTYLATIKDSANMLIGIVDDMQDFSRIDTGVLELNETPFDLKESMKETADSISTQVSDSKKPIKFLYDYAADVPHGIFGDKSRLVQIVKNLLKNSLTHTLSGDVSLSVSLQQPHDTDAFPSKDPLEGMTRIYFSVSGGGLGVSPDKLDSIFDFAEGNSGGKSHIGLGLRIIKELVELMHGRVIIVNNESKGAAFVFYVDVKALLSEEYNKLCRTKVGSDKTEMTVFPDLSVLVAEDNKINQEVVKATLHKLGISCDIANNGKEALEHMENKDYQLIFMDLKMPELDGWEATRLIRANTFLKDQPVIVALTASSTPKDRRMAKRAGVDDILIKPAPLAQISQIIEYYFGIKAKEHSAKAKNETIEI